MTYLLTKWCLRSTDHLQAIPPFRHFICDLVLVAGAVGAWYLYGLTLQALALVILVLSGIVISITDFSYEVIPDWITLTGIVTGILIATFSGHIQLLNALAGGVLGFLLFNLLAAGADRLLKKKAMGGGDIKLAAMLGVFLGWQLLILTLFAAAVLALLFVLGRRLLFGISLRARIPFGPFLVYAALSSFVCGRSLIDLYLEIVGLGGGP